ncbi:hypothetical protein [Hymenobacter sp. 102]|uniref:hypothetical protein n=1 Tax=Hymenobacter sp. 102 TaxID=3403152 RepID=UPI003CF1F200
MRTLSLPAGHTIDLFQTVHELPARRHLHFNALLVQAGGIGNTPQDINDRFGRVGQLLAAGKTAEAITEFENLHYAFHFALSQFSPTQQSFGVLVAAVDGQPVADFSPDALTRLLEQLSGWGLSAGMVEAEVSDVKKNCQLN